MFVLNSEHNEVLTKFFYWWCDLSNATHSAIFIIKVPSNTAFRYVFVGHVKVTRLGELFNQHNFN